MDNLLLIEQLSKNLTNHENSIRIKKILLYACRNIWSNDSKTLAQLNMQDLIKEFLDVNPSIKHSKFTLYNVAKSLSKSEEYTVIAKEIIKELEKINPEEITENSISKISPNSSTLPTYPTNQNPIQSPFQIQQKPNYNHFDLRMEVIKYANPLRAKILIFSALNNIFDFSDRDWLKLRKETLDDLLQNLLNACPNLTELEYKLYTTANLLGEKPENNQAVNSIIQAIKPLYRDAEKQVKTTQIYTPSNKPEIAETIIHPFTVEDQEETCQFYFPSEN